MPTYLPKEESEFLIKNQPQIKRLAEMGKKIPMIFKRAHHIKNSVSHDHSISAGVDGGNDIYFLYPSGPDSICKRECTICKDGISITFCGVYNNVNIDELKKLDTLKKMR